MTKERSQVARKKKLLRKTTGIRSSSMTEPMFTSSSTVPSHVTAAIERNQKLQTQTTGTNDPSSTQPMFTSSYTLPSHIIAAIERTKMLRTQKTTGTSGPSSTQPMFTSSSRVPSHVTAATELDKMLQTQTTGISGPSPTLPMFTSSSSVLSYVIATIERDKKLQTQTTGISGPSSGSSHDRAASEKAFLDSIVIADPYPPQRTQNDIVNSTPWLEALCPTLLANNNKGSERTMTQALHDMAEAEMARHSCSPDYDSDEEWDDYEGGCRDESHLANDDLDWDWFRSTMVHPHTRYEER